MACVKDTELWFISFWTEIQDRVENSAPVMNGVAIAARYVVRSAQILSLTKDQTAVTNPKSADVHELIPCANGFSFFF